MTQAKTEARPDTIGAGLPASRQVNWFETFEFAQRFAASHGLALDDLPIAGTPRWCDMPDRDARKLLALVLGGVREALQHDIRQEAMADASREISTMAPWSKVGRGRGPSYIRRHKEAV